MNDILEAIDLMERLVRFSGYILTTNYILPKGCKARFTVNDFEGGVYSVEVLNLTGMVKFSLHLLPKDEFVKKFSTYLKKEFQPSDWVKNED